MDDDVFAVESGGDTSADSTPAVDAPAPDVADGSNFQQTGEGPADAPSGDSNLSAGAKPTKHKATIGGAEVELTTEEMLARLSDDYEHTLKIDGREERHKYNDLMRLASLSGGAMSKMHKAAEMTKAAQTRESEWLENPDTFHAALAAHKGESVDLDDDGYTPAERRAIEMVQSLAARDELAKRDPVAHAREMYKAAESRRQAVERFKAERAGRETQAQQAQQARQQLFASIPKALEGVGLPANRITKALVGGVMSEMQRAGLELNPADIAAHTRDHYQRELRATFDALEAPGLEALIGEAAVKKLQKQASKALKDAQKAERAATPNDPNRPRSNGKKELSLRDI